MLAAGFPIRQSLQNFVLVTASILVGLALIPVLGIVGAALGVAGGTLCAMAILTVFGRRHVGWDMMRNCRIGNGHA
jgi:small neutral amino acid transporter SnatA (MarC family)